MCCGLYLHSKPIVFYWFLHSINMSHQSPIHKNQPTKNGNKYVNFVSDEHFLRCVANLHKSYATAKNNCSRKSFYANKIDPIKLIADTKFNSMSVEQFIEAEVIRQHDKSVNNAIGIFHEQILGGIEGFEQGNKSGYDIKAIDNSLFAEIKNKHNTMNSGAAKSVFQKLAEFAERHPQAQCYCVKVWSKNSFNEPWTSKATQNERIRMISGDKFYALLSKQEDALWQLYRALPIAIGDYLSTSPSAAVASQNSIADTIRKDAQKRNSSTIDHITRENYSYYLGFHNADDRSSYSETSQQSTQLPAPD